jgi:phytoene synthase
MGRELDAAGITDPALRASYAACRQLNAAHGRTYYLATLLLPPWKRPYVHALYGFARYADEIVDDLASTLATAEKAAWLDDWSRRFWSGESDDPVLPAVLDTVRRWDIPLEHFAAFLASMRMDLTVDSYATFDDLMRYVEGSAAVIGLQMVPVLEPADPVAAAPFARDLGVAFQLSNFVRDVGEDLRRGRLYLPLEDLAAHGVERSQLEAGVVDGRVRRLLAFEVERTRAIYRRARPGIELLHPTSRHCIRTAFRLYGGILDEVERADYRVLDRRVAVPLRKRLTVAGPGLGGAWLARQRTAAGRDAVPARPTTPASA